jgi:hypothetical protein
MMILLFLLYALAIGLAWKGLGAAAFALSFFLAAANVVTTLLMCGLAECPDNPTAYLWLR